MNFEPFLLSALMSDLNEVITQSEIRVRPVYSTTSFSFHILSRISDWSSSRKTPVMEKTTGSLITWSLMSEPFSTGFDVTLLLRWTLSVTTTPVFSASRRTVPHFSPVMVYATKSPPTVHTLPAGCARDILPLSSPARNLPSPVLPGGRFLQHRLWWFHRPA